jgi:hypothetical protein
MYVVFVSLELAIGLAMLVIARAAVVRIFESNMAPCFWNAYLLGEI